MQFCFKSLITLQSEDVISHIWFSLRSYLKKYIFQLITAYLNSYYTVLLILPTLVKYNEYIVDIDDWNAFVSVSIVRSKAWHSRLSSLFSRDQAMENQFSDEKKQIDEVCWYPRGYSRVCFFFLMFISIICPTKLNINTRLRWHQRYCEIHKEMLWLLKCGFFFLKCWFSYEFNFKIKKCVYLINTS